MLRRIIFTLFVVITIAGGVVGYMYYQKLKVPIAAAINAIPQDAHVIIQVSKANTLWKNIQEQSLIWKSLKTTPYFNNLESELINLSKIISEYGRLENALDNSPLLISYHRTDTINSGFLFSISIPADIDGNYLLEDVIKYNSSNDVYFSKRTYAGTIIYEVKNRNTANVLSYSIKKGVFVASYNPLVLEKSLQQLEENLCLNDNVNFNRVYKTLNTQTELSVIINYPLFFADLRPLLNDSLNGVINNLQNTAQWCALDIKQNQEWLFASGLSITDNNNQFLNAFSNQKPSKQTLFKLFPYSTAAYIYYNLSDFNSFYSQYKTLLKLSENSSTYINCLGNEFALVFSSNWSPVNNQEVFLIGKPVALSTVTTQLINASVPAKKSSSKQKENNDIIEGDLNDVKNNKKAVKETESNKEDNSNKSDSTMIEKTVKQYEIRKLTSSFNWHKSLGSTFSVISDNYFSIIDEYVVFANSYDALNDLIQEYISNSSLETNPSFKTFNQNQNNNSSLSVYYNASSNTEIVRSWISKNFLSTLEPYVNLFSLVDGLGIQISYNKGLFYTSVTIKHTSTNTEFKPNEANTQQLKFALDAPAIIKPKMVINHQTQEKEIIVQDSNNQLYLFNNKGEMLWKRPLEEPILSDIIQIDRYKNNKLQYVFNTRNYIYMIDRNGNTCEGFPVKLKYPSTNTMAVFDYENTRDYRFLIACENNRVYNYDANGENVMGWEFTLMKSPIKHPVQHFVINGKDYILAIDQTGEIRLVDRKGKSILDFRNKIPIAPNSDFYIEKGKELSSTYLYATDSIGRVYKFKFNDRLDIIELPKKFSKNHFFEFKDINNDGQRDFIITDGYEINVYNQKQLPIMYFKTKANISHKPLFFLFPNNKIKIGLVNATNNTIYLINNEGNLETGFPKAGCGLFSIGHLNSSPGFNMVVPSTGKHLYNYAFE